MKYFTFSVVALSPVVASTRLSKNKVVRPEKLPIGSCSDRIHGAGLKIEEDGTGHVFAHAGLVVVHIDSLQLQVGGAIIVSSTVDAMLVGDDLPEL